MSIGISTNQSSAPNSLTPGLDNNPSNPASEDAVDIFSTAMREDNNNPLNGRPAAPNPNPEILGSNFQQAVSGPILASPFASETRLGDANPFANINFSNITNNFGPGIEISDNGHKLINSIPQGLTGQIESALNHSSVFQKLNPDARNAISKMLENIATGDFSPNNVIEGTFDAIIDNTNLPPNEKQDITKFVNALCDVVSTAMFIASLPESCLAVFSEDAPEAISAINNLAQTAKGWLSDAGVQM
jgi:hypothetical protein